MKTQSGRIALALLLAALLTTGCATPQNQKAQAERDALCAALDANHDGKITKEEFIACANDKKQASELFEKLDSGKKGHLTYDEVWGQRVLLPPEISMMSPGITRPFR